MDLSLGMVARTLDVSESSVQDYIASGSLKAERKGQYLFVSESALRAFMESEEKLAQENALASPEPSEAALSREALRPIMHRLSALQKQLEEKLDLVKDNQRLSEELKRKEENLLLKGYELEKLKQEYAHQKRLLEKDLEARQIILEEKWAVMQKETSEQIEQERGHLHEMLVVQERRWMEKLDEEREQFARQLEEAKRREGLWSRLIKMMTWS